MEDDEDVNAGQADTYHGRFCGYPGMVWYSKVTKTLGADLRIGDMLDSLDHHGARPILGLWADDRRSPTRVVCFSDIEGDSEIVRADVLYDVVDPDSQVTPDGTPVTDFVETA